MNKHPSVLIPISALGINPTALLSRQVRFGSIARNEVAAALARVDPFGFSWLVRIRCDNPLFGGLDFLGFYRPKLDLSMGYEHFRRNNSRCAFDGVTSAGKAAGRSVGLALRKAGLLIGQSLINFLIIYNRLSSGPQPSGASI